MAMRGIVIVARTRTGTNWLRQHLSACSTGQNLGEFLRPDERFDGNFFDWFDRVHGVFPSYRGQAWVTDVLSGYLDHTEYAYPVPILDLKYSAFSAFEPSWRSPLGLPIILRLLIKRGYKVIHHRREDVLATAVSEMVAAQTGIYTSYDAISTPPVFDLDAEKTVRLALEYREELSFVSRLLAQHCQVTDLSYESLLEAEDIGCLPDRLRDLIDGTDLEPRPQSVVAIRRLLPDWRSSVRNWRDIIARANAAALI